VRKRTVSPEKPLPHGRGSVLAHAFSDALLGRGNVGVAGSTAGRTGKRPCPRGPRADPAGHAHRRTNTTTPSGLMVRAQKPVLAEQHAGLRGSAAGCRFLGIPQQVASRPRSVVVRTTPHTEGCHGRLLSPAGPGISSVRFNIPRTRSARFRRNNRSTNCVWRSARGPSANPSGYSQARCNFLAPRHARPGAV